MNNTDLFTIFKTRVGEPNASATRVVFLQQMVDSATAFIKREGVELPYDVTTGYTVEDAELIMMYAEYLLKKRNTGEGMPRALRFAMNNRLFSEVADES